MAVIGGLAAAGLAFTYMAQREATELRVLQDEHLAQQNAHQMGKGKAPELAVAQTIEYPENQRADGQKWEIVMASRAQNENLQQVVLS